jgi:hypothetical protein
LFQAKASRCRRRVSGTAMRLKFGAYILCVEVPTSFRWINRLVSSQCIIYFHRSKFEQV